MGVTTEARSLFGNDPDTRARHYYLISPSAVIYVGSSLEIAARQTGKHLADAVEW